MERSIEIWPQRGEVVASNESKRSELIRAYGGGRLLDSERKVVLGEVIGEGQFTYVVGFPDNVVAAVDKEMTLTVNPGVDDGRNFFYILSQLQKGLPETLFKVTNHKWKSGLVNAVRAGGSPGLADYITCSPWPTDVPRVQIRDAIHGTLVKSWSSPYEDPAGVLDFVYNTLNKYVQQYKSVESYVVPLAAVVQSSGWGKSRTMNELYKKDIYIVYVSFMPEGSGGFPQGSAVAALLTVVTPRHVVAWLVAILAVLARSKKSPAEWKEWQETLEYVNAVKDRMQSYLASEIQPRFTKGITGKDDWQDVPLQNWASKNIQELWGLSGGPVRVLFCLDEARHLFRRDSEAYVNTRRAFTCIPRGAPIFGVVVDTSAKLQELLPQSESDPSLRFIKAERGMFPPICLVGVCWNNSEQLLLSFGETIAGEDPTQPSDHSSRELFKCGRPLWRSAVGKNSLDQVVLFAVQKLLGGRSLSSVLTQRAPKLSVGMSMAILSVIAGLEVAPFTELAIDMVASHMRTCTFISENRAQMYTTDVFEPILGEAACRVLNYEGILSEVLSGAVRLCKDTLAVEGPRGELVGRIYLVLAMNSCCRRGRFTGGFNHYSHPVLAQDFLSELCGKQVKARGLVCFNRFLIVKRYKYISRRLLLLCFACAVCIIPVCNQEGYDLLVPQLMPDADGKYQLLENRMQAIPVQVLNRNSSAIDTGRLRKYASFYQCFDAELLSTYQECYEPEEVAVGGASDDPMENTAMAVDNDSDEMGSDCSTEEDDAKKEPDYVLPDLRQEKDMHTEPDYVLPDLRQEKDMHTDNDPSESHDYVGAVYLHLRTNAPRVEQENEVLVVHGIHPNLVLNDKDAETLRSLLVAYFQLEDNYKGDDGVIRKMMPHYFLPLYPSSIDEVESLTAEGLQKILPKKLKLRKGDLAEKAKELIRDGKIKLPKDPLEM